MRRAWLVLCIGCGTSGEPIHGNIAVTYGTAMPKMVVGSAVTDKQTAGNMVVQLGSDNVDCGTYLDEFLTLNNPSGVFVYFSVSATTPGSNANLFVNVEKSTGNNVNINSASGTVTIDSIDTRVMGSIDFTVTDMMVGTISVSGAFDVKKCF
jgi:hypothetical protein